MNLPPSKRDDRCHSSPPWPHNGRTCGLAHEREWLKLCPELNIFESRAPPGYVPGHI